MIAHVLTPYGTLIFLGTLFLSGCQGVNTTTESNQTLSKKTAEPINVSTSAPTKKNSTDKGVVMIVINDPRGDSRKFGGSNPLYSANISYDKDPLLQRISQKLLKDYKLTSQDQWPIKNLGVHCIVVNMPSDEILKKIKSDRRVAWVQNFNSFETQFSYSYASSNLNDTQAHLNKNTPPIKMITPDMALPNLAQGVKIMVIDTGVNIAHPAFKQSKVKYKNFVKNKKNATQEAHGLAVTGLLGAKALQSDAPVKGLTQDASLYHYRGCWQDNNGAGKCSTLTLALALDAAVDTQPDIINLSLSGPPDRILEALLHKLIAKGSIIVSAYDAKRTAAARFPKAQAGVIYAYGIADIEHGQSRLKKALPQNTFKASSTALSLAPNGEYDIYTGHSIAAPQVTATVASLLSKDPSISKDTIAKRLAQWLTAP